MVIKLITAYLMSNTYFQFKQFVVHQDLCAMKVTTDSCLFGAWVADRLTGSIREGQKILDIGTGTGLLSLMLAQKTTAGIDTIEIDDNACRQAKQNITASPWRNRITLFHGDVRTFPFDKKYDIIISNPPFYENELRSGDLQKNKAHHNESLLLEDLLKIAGDQLTDSGRLFLILPYKRNEEIERLMRRYRLSVYEKLLMRQSMNHGHFRIVVSVKKSTDVLVPEENEIAIRDNQEQYTTEFIQLLRDYYLHL